MVSVWNAMPLVEEHTDRIPNSALSYITYLFDSFTIKILLAKTIFYLKRINSKAPSYLAIIPLRTICDICKEGHLNVIYFRFKMTSKH